MNRAMRDRDRRMAKQPCVLRGGSWYTPQDDVRCSSRLRYSPDGWRDGFGVRLSRHSAQGEWRKHDACQKLSSCSKRRHLMRGD